MHLLLVLVLHAAQPETAVVLGSRLGVPPARASVLFGATSQALRAKGLEAVPDDALSRRLRKLGVKDPANCAGKRACLIELGAQLKVARIIVVSVAEVKPDLSVSLEALDVATGERLASASGIVDAASASVEADVATAADELMRALAPVAAPEPPRVVDTSKPADLPAPIAPAEVGAQTAAASPPAQVVAPVHPRTRSWLLGAGAIVFGGAAAALAIHAFVLADPLRGTAGLDGQLISTLSEPAAASRAGQANVELSLAIGAAAVAVVLALLVALLPAEAP